MGFWKKTKQRMDSAADVILYTQEYTEEDAKRVANEMKHEVEPKILLSKFSTRAPIEYLNEGERLCYLLKGLDLDIDDNDEGSHSKLLVTEKKVKMVATSITAKESQYTVAFQDIIGISIQKRLKSHIRIQTAGHSYKISVTRSTSGLVDEAVDYIQRRKEEIEK